MHFKSEVFERLKKEHPDAESDEEFISSLRLHNLMDSLPMIANSDDNLIARVVLHEDIIPYISQLREQFTQLMLDDVVDFGSFYSYRIYLMMMQFRSTGICTIKISDLRETLELKDKYEATKDLRKWVIDTAVDEINGKSPFNVTYEMTKTGRKFTHLVIKFKAKNRNTNTIKDAVLDTDTVDISAGSTDNDLKPLSLKTADMFGNLMGYDDGFGSKYGSVGESKPSFISRIKRELQTVEGTKRYADDLRKFGYKSR